METLEEYNERVAQNNKNGVKVNKLSKNILIKYNIMKVI